MEDGGESSHLNIHRAEEPTSRLFPASTVRLLHKARQEHGFSVAGFHQCPMLDNAVFDGMVYLHPLQATIAERNPTERQFVDLIDENARRVERWIMGRFASVDPQDVRRLSCYTAAEGAVPFLNLTNHRLLKWIEPANYFADVFPNLAPEMSLIPGPRRKYKIAYLLMVHEESGFRHLKLLVDLLDDGEAIILIHVDHRSDALYRKIDDWIRWKETTTLTPEGGADADADADNDDASPVNGQNRFRAKQRRVGNVFLARYRYSNIWGHISLVYTQLAGFWELQDLADWDYVINLSNYDWPLRRNAAIHRVLSQEKYAGKVWIEYWADTQDLAERFFRPHMGDKKHTATFHPPDLGLIAWPFPNWKAYKHHQWMILTPECIGFLRRSRAALNLLAFMDHTFIPDESFFATALINMPEWRNRIINDKKRYLRFDGSDAAHPSWLGWNDRHLFPPGEKEPSYFFARKLNALGDYFGEDKLLAWIRVNHLDMETSSTDCTIEQAPFRPECLRMLLASSPHPAVDGGSAATRDATSANASAAGDPSQQKEVIVVPVNRAMLPLVANLRCSLRNVRGGAAHIVHWSLDAETHDALTAQGYTSLYMQAMKDENASARAPSPHRLLRHSPELTRLSHHKPSLIRKILTAGYDVWFLDADTVVLQDFRSKAVAVPEMDVAVGMGEATAWSLSVGQTPVSAALPAAQVPRIATGIMFFRQGVRTDRFLDAMQRYMKEDPALDDEDAVARVLAEKAAILISVGEHAADIAPATTAATPTAANAGTWQLDALPRTGSEMDLPRVHVLSQFEFPSGRLFFDTPAAIPVDVATTHRVVHANGAALATQDPSEPDGLRTIQSRLQQRGLWFLQPDNVQCLPGLVPGTPARSRQATLEHDHALTAEQQQQQQAQQQQAQQQPSQEPSQPQEQQLPKTPSQKQQQQQQQQQQQPSLPVAGGAPQTDPGDAPSMPADVKAALAYPTDAKDAAAAAATVIAPDETPTAPVSPPPA